jgi:hypothetical protein
MHVSKLVECVTSEAPPLRHSVDDIVAAGQRVQRRRRRGWAAMCTAALTAAAVTAAISLPRLISHPRTAAGATLAAGATTGAGASAPKTFSPPSKPFTFTLASYDVGRFHVKSPIVVSTAYEIASVYEDGRTTHDYAVDPATLPQQGKPVRSEPTLYAYLILYRPGAFNPAGLDGAEKVTVAGHPGLQTSDQRDTVKKLAWQYTDNAWAVLESYSSDKADPSAKDLQEVAAGLTSGEQTPAKLPFTMTYVPAGFHPVEVGTHAFVGLDGIAGARDGDFGGALFAKPAPRTTGLTEPFGAKNGSNIPGSFQIFITPNKNSNQSLKNGQKPPAEPACQHGFCNSWSPDGAVNIQVSSEGRLSDGEMSKILKGITLATVDDPNTWTDAATAIPVQS